jgi:hypothetical protein
MIPDFSPNGNNKLNWRKILRVLNPFGTERLDVTYKGDPDKKRLLLLIMLRINHILIFVTIPVAIIALTSILPNIGYVPHSNYDINIIAIFVYLFAIFFIIAGYKWGKIYSWLERHTNFFNHYNFNDVFADIFNSHLYRIVNFLIIVVLAFFLGLADASWFVITPLFAVSGLALVLTYPTIKRINRWKDEFESHQ